MATYFKNNLITIALLSALLVAGCSNNPGATPSSSADVPGVQQGAGTVTTGNNSQTAGAEENVTDSVKYDADDALVKWDASSATTIALSGATATVSGSGASVEQGVVTITTAGDYVVSGTLDDGRIVVDAPDKVVHLVLNGAHVTSKSGAAVHLVEAGKVVLTLQDGTSNSLTDAATYADTSDNAPTAALFSKADLTINGTGALQVTGNYNDGITSKDDLIIMSGTLSVKAVDDGLVGKDLVAVKSGEITIDAGGDGIKSTNDTDQGKGEIVIEGGSFNIQSVNDAIQSATSLYIADGVFGIVSGGGHTASTKTRTEEMWGGGGFGGRGQMPNGTGELPQRQQGTEGTPPTQGSDRVPPSGTNRAQAPTQNAGPAAVESTSTVETESSSAKGLKASGGLVVAGGQFEIDAADDTIHSNTSVRIVGGQFTLASGDDAIHADVALAIDGGSITITNSYEGLESASITISGGEIHVTASDDGVNASDGSGSEARPGSQQNAGGNGVSLTITGGELTVHAGGDGLDSNGSIVMSGGLVLVNGPTGSGNGALDYDGTFTQSGGTLIAAGSSGMAQAPSTGSTQHAIMMNFTSTLEGGTLVTLTNSKSKLVAAFAPAKAFQTVVISSPELKSGENYTLSTGGTNDGKAMAGYYANGTTTGSKEVVSFTTGNDAVTYLNESGVTTGGGMGMGGRGGGMGGPGRGNSDMGSRPGSNTTDTRQG